MYSVYQTQKLDRDNGKVKGSIKNSTGKSKEINYIQIFGQINIID